VVVQIATAAGAAKRYTVARHQVLLKVSSLVTGDHHWVCLSSAHSSVLVSLAEYNEAAVCSQAGTLTWSEGGACTLDVVTPVEADRTSASVAPATRHV